jgi:hypothetical protein
MVDATTTNRKHQQRKRVELRFDVGCTPHPWRRFLIAGAAVCHSIQVLREQANTLNKGEDEHDSS